MFKMSQMIILLYLFLPLLAAGVGWWLSGYDPKVTGENKDKDFIRRILRILGTAILIAVLFGLNPAGMGSGYGFIPILLIAPIAVAVIWCGCISECWTQAFHHLLFSGDKGHFDPNKGVRDLDNLAMLLKNGRRGEALQLAEELKESGDVNVLTLETMLSRAGVEWTTPRAGDPVVKAGRLRAQGDFAGAEKILLPFLEQNPAHVQALVLLLRLYAQNLKQPDKAAGTLRRLEQVPHIPRWQVEYAQRSLHDWSQPEPVSTAAVPLPESVDELLAQGYSGTAIEILEQKIKEQPADFDSWLKLAEAQGLYCHNMGAAEKIVRNIETSRAFTAEQIQTAQTKLAEWRRAAKK